jgi:hypothetical protein
MSIPNNPGKYEGKAVIEPAGVIKCRPEWGFKSIIIHETR